MDAVQEFVTVAVTSPWMWLVLLLVCALDALFPPLPSDEVVVGVAAVAASTGAPTLWSVVLVATVGAVIGDNLVYGVGRWVGIDRFAWMRRPRAVAAFTRARGILDRRGAVVILTARFVPIGRVAVNLCAGATKFPRTRFVPLTVAAALGWAVFTVTIGALAGTQFAGQPLLATGIGICCALGLGLVADRLITRRLSGDRGGRRDGDGHDDAAGPGRGARRC
ncbi:DedA family protein [Rhodococcus opacus]|uniref:DedA family protein n=1 Tax=Rhodococcus opacus TaxID=37919 RepID=UPI00155A2C84|nr:DedA family protein [Rhodococcus opacus]